MRAKEALNRSVKIQTRVSKRHYLRAKRTYEYGQMSLHIPRKYHEIIKPFLEQDFDVNATIENDRLVITLSPADRFQLSMKRADDTLK